MEMESEKLTCVPKNLHPQQVLLAGGIGGHEKIWLLKAGSVTAFVKMQTAYQNAKKHSESSDFSAEAYP